MNETLMRPPHRCASQSAAPRAAVVPTPAVAGAAATSALVAPAATVAPCCRARLVTDGDAKAVLTVVTVERAVLGAAETADVGVSLGAAVPFASAAGAC